MRKSDYLEVGINIKDLVPARAVHPGELLRDVLKAKGYTQKRFAEMSGIQPTQINEVINEKRGISAEMALKIGDVLKMDANSLKQSLLPIRSTYFSATVVSFSQLVHILSRNLHVVLAV